MIFTIGHSTRPVRELIGLLRSHEVDLLVDVRRYPGSRRNPQYARDALERTLREVGIAYRHAPELGGRRSTKDRPARHTPSANRGWRNASFRAYADYMGTSAFRAALERLKNEAHGRNVVIMCAEAVPWRCHRNLISDALVAADTPVRHIISGAEPQSHTLNSMARPGPDGGITYPGEDDQPDLF